MIIKRIIPIILLIISSLVYNSIYAQNLTPFDSLLLKYNPRSNRFIKFRHTIPLFKTNKFIDTIQIEYDSKNQYYILHKQQIQNLCNQLYYLTLEEYTNYLSKLIDRKTWNNIMPTQQYTINTIALKNPAFSKLFGGQNLDILAQGNIDINLAAQFDKTKNPFINEKIRKQFNLDFSPNIDMKVWGKIGDKASFLMNINSKAQFDFENQIRFDYKGRDDDIVKKIEIGETNFLLNTTLIQSPGPLFGLKGKLQFGKLSFIGVIAEKKYNSREIVLKNGLQNGKLNLALSDYEANKHYFLAQFFRDNYNKALSIPNLINSPIYINQIEVWINKESSTSIDSRNILALLDLGEFNPYNSIINKNTTPFVTNAIYQQIPTDKANDLLQQLDESARSLNNSTVHRLFATTGSLDNYTLLSSAQKLREGIDFIINRQLGYISLHTPLLNNQVLAVSYRYSINGTEYQVGEFTTDIPESSSTPSVLFVKLLKNEISKTTLPTWNLMMKNIYSLGTTNIKAQNTDFHILRKDNISGLESNIQHEGRNTKNRTWLELTYLDRISQNSNAIPDGRFDWIPNITINNETGHLIFPVIEPFGKDLEVQFAPEEKDLVESYTFSELYTHTKSDAIQNYAHKDRYTLQGNYTTGNINEINLGGLNLTPESIHVTSGNSLLKEHIDYYIDYETGILRILNSGLLVSEQIVTIRIEDRLSPNSTPQLLLGGHFEYPVNNNLKLGATIVHLSENIKNQKISIGNEAISNLMYGFDINYSKTSPWLTRLINKIPFIYTKDSSRIDFHGEFAQLVPMHPFGSNNSGTSKETSYIDDFESSFNYVDIKSQFGWEISATPNKFKESSLSNELAYGYNRALLSVYSIDPIFYQSSASINQISNQYLLDHRSRRITEQEVFSFKEVRRGTDLFLPTLDFVYYPMIRGPYNYATSSLLPDGTFSNPQQKWGGTFKKLEETDFEAVNIDFLEMWLMDPELTNPNKTGGDIYFNLGNISEDILKDGRKSIENALSPIGDINTIDQTAWGKVSKQQPQIYAFENTNESRALQDLGLDGLNNEEERLFHTDFLNRAQRILNSEAFEKLQQDPSSDDYIYYKGKHFNQTVNILDRYKYINGTQGNSRTSTQSQIDFGVEFSARTLYPDGEDINHDNIMNETDAYYQYKFSTRPQDLIIGKNHIVDEQIARVLIQNKYSNVKWYKIRIPIQDYESKIGNINDFKNIRYIRIFMTNFLDTAVLRFATMQFVKGDWRKYNTENNINKIIADPALLNPNSDNSSYNISNINIEENGKRTPIPYVVPPGISRIIDYTSNSLNTQQNEQALSLQIINLKDGYGRAAYKRVQHDLRPYGKIEMFVHAEGQHLIDGDFTMFIRIGADDEVHYYEFEQPLSITQNGEISPELIWPIQNRINIPLRYFQEAKSEREKTNINGNSWPLDQPFEYRIDNGKITLLGNPNLSDIRFYMIGVKNPLQKTFLSNSTDNGSALSGEFWFNELRLTEFDKKSGWAALARLNVQLGDFANITLTSAKSYPAYELHVS